MTAQENRRSRITRRVFRESLTELMLEQGMQKISVNEICKRADMNRSTFYAHYQDVYDLVERVERNMSRQLTESFFRKMDEKAPARDCFTEIFSFIREHREFYLYYLAESRQSGVLQLAWDVIRDRIAETELTPASFGVGTQEEMAYHGAFFLMGMTAVVRLWLQNGCREEPSALYELLRRQSAVQETMIGW